ncbi:39S ribosomal protein L46, mitochondrial [Hondaea fermentalgiana]|uniref:39S ribosomal protein L46, mitochondrial n=1 Tax=Hondaea fermentalgiana TaxID=2315210 RepID=A0A2R5GJR6_9STRA|nr:39S ribosomal protein L46, mitochondrial [Hondaea fermentalgiana]|eukprot:GBG28104.1 39S ribosomal protein L46, mitochondrial [Hondaea fermentalgiana]
MRLARAMGGGAAAWRHGGMAPRLRHGAARGLATAPYPKADAPGAAVDEEHWRDQYKVEKLMRDTPVESERSLRAKERLRFMEFEAFKKDAEAAGLKIDVMCGAVVERLPVIMPDLEDWEVDMFELKEEAELYEKKEYPREFWTHRERPIQKQNLWAYDLLDYGTKGRLGRIEIDDELRKELEPMLEEYRAEEEQRIADLEAAQLKERELKASGKAVNTVVEEEDSSSLDIDENLDLSSELDLDISNIEIEIDEDTTQEIEYDLNMDDVDAAGQGSQQDFRPEPRITLEDKIHDTRSLRRRLQRRLHLLVKVRDPADPNGEPVWRFPFGLRDDGEELYAAAKRHTLAQCGEDIDLYMLGRLPAGYHWVKYAEAEQKERQAYGALVLFYRGQRIEGHVAASDDILDHVWISSDELEQIVPKAASDPYWSYGRHFMDA